MHEPLGDWRAGSDAQPPLCSTSASEGDWRAGSDAQPPLCSTSASEEASECRHGESEGVPRMSANHRPNVERAPTCVLARRTDDPAGAQGRSGLRDSIARENTSVLVGVTHIGSCSHRRDGDEA
jgi:hypothetical protein